LPQHSCRAAQARGADRTVTGFDDDYPVTKEKLAAPMKSFGNLILITLTCVGLGPPPYANARHQKAMALRGRFAAALRASWECPLALRRVTPPTLSAGAPSE